MVIPVPLPISGISRVSALAARGADRLARDRAGRLLLRSGIVVVLAREGSASEGGARRTEASTGDAQATPRAPRRWHESGKTEEALAEFDKAITIDPHHAEALYSRGLLYQRERQHQLAIDDFTSANGLTPQRAEPLLARAISYLAMDKFKEAAADLDEAVQADPQNAQIWTTRGQAYERLGDKAKAAASYGRAIAIRPRDEAARSGLARVGG